MNFERGLYECRHCNNILTKTAELPFPETRYLALHVAASLINNPPADSRITREEQKRRKDDRKRFCYDLKRFVSTLRNSKGGVILVHIAGLEETDSCLHHFHELVDPRLNEIIENGSLFVNVYRKNWLPPGTDGDQYPEFVAIGVLPSYKVVTVDFNTKVPQDFSIVDPTSKEIVKYLRAAERFRNIEPCLRGLNLSEESRNIQHKAFFEEKQQFNNPGLFAEHIWDTLKLGRCISAFSKVEGGGSFYLGVAERRKQFPSYVTIEHYIKGFEYDSEHLDILGSSLRQQIENHTVVLFFDADDPPAALPPECVKIKFYTIESNLFVCEVAIAAVNGLVFHTKEGPEAYELNECNDLSRLDINEWKKRLLTKSLKSD